MSRLDEDNNIPEKFMLLLESANANDLPGT